MENKDWIRKLMAYLYDEMSMEEKQSFEKVLDSDPELMKEFKSFKGVRQALGSVKDKEVPEPASSSQNPESFHWQIPPKAVNMISLRTVISIAASIILIMTIGYLTQFRVQYQNGSLFIGFNRQAVPAQNAGFTEDQIKNLVNNEMEQNYGSLVKQLVHSDSSIHARLTSVETGLESVTLTASQTPPSVTRADLEAYIRLTQNNQAKMLKDYLQSTVVRQNQYFETTLTRFSEIIQEQRESDLYMIQSNLITMKEYQDQQKEETNQVLARIFTTVTTQNE